jgi:hypothetical protein
MAGNFGLNAQQSVKGDRRKSLVPQDFLTLWKDADPGVPILKQAQAEYAKLQ